MYVCVCEGVTDSRIREEIQAGATTMRALRQRLGVASRCGSCGKCARALLTETLSEASETSTVPLAPAPAPA